MSGHTRWSDSEGARLVRDEALSAQQHMVAFVQGYIQALEDIQGDLEKVFERCGDRETDWQEALSYVTHDVARSLVEALRTRDQLRKK